jgi:hypothetical protein
MYRFEALVHYVEPLEIDGLRWGARMEVDVIRGAIAAGELVTIGGAGGHPVGSVPVDEVAERDDPGLADPEARWLYGRPPRPGSRLVLSARQIAPTKVPVRARIHSPIEADHDLPILSPWAAVFDLLLCEEEALTLAYLIVYREERLRANGELIAYFLGHLESSRATATALHDRMDAQLGHAQRLSWLDLVSAYPPPTDEQCAAFVDRIAAHGIMLTFEKI